ncbi:nuclear pore glycoprotein p62-like isoform X2 [Trichoplusia ni]|uniref:Nuclear pore glycoprotein p62-like isoform X2 n=1 Tax=Trichoplusia ni TaxID=7111 RepID=A0A7E5W4J4_TRINI|nr:nuclear pore glycoprotein p62-like isoform X2 [Trichoplusia ni]
MSFSFGSATTTASSTFGTATPSTGFAFGSGDTAKPGGLFGASNAVSSPTTTNAAPAFGASKPMGFGGFASPPNQTIGSPSFGQPAAQASPQNLSFGQTQPQQQQQPPPAFGSPSQAPAFGSSPSTGFGFNKPATTTSGFGFATPTSGFSAPAASTAITSTAQQPQTTQSFLSSPQTGSGMGFSQSAFGAKPGSAFSFGGGTALRAPAPGAATTLATGFGLPSQQPQATQSGLSFGTTTSTTQQQTPAPRLGSGLSFGTQPAATPAFGTGTTTTGFQSQPQTGLSFGGPVTSTPAMSAAQPTSGTGLSFGTTPASQPQTGLSFGAPSSTAQPSTGLSFGASAATSQPSGLSFGAPVSAATSLIGATTSQPSTGLSFGTPATTGLSFGATTTTSTGLSFGATTSASTGLSFGAPTSSTATVQPVSGFAATTSAAATSGISFGTTSTPATGLSTAPTTGLSFGTSTASSQGTGLTFGSTSTSATSGTGFTGAASSLSFGRPITTTAVSSAASTTAPSGITALGKTTATTTMASLTTATTTTTAAPPQMVTSITFAQLEENINKWTLELEEQEKTFINQATQINAWDRLLIANGEKIVELNDAVQSVKNEQQSLEHELEFVLAQQKELEDLLAPMEKQLLEDTGDRLRDPEREHMYTLAENLDTQLRQMSEDLKEVIEHLNETNRSQDSNDPIVQIGRILNAHMSSMQWIDNSIAQISTKLDQLKATHDTLRRDNERSFQLTYN